MIRPQDTTAKPFIKSALFESGTSIFIFYLMTHIHEGTGKLQNKREEDGKGNRTWNIDGDKKKERKKKYIYYIRVVFFLFGCSVGAFLHDFIGQGAFPAAPQC